MRTLYIVGGSHTCDGMGLQDFNRIIALTDIQDRFIADLAFTEQVTGYFQDGCSEKAASQSNSLLECLVQHNTSQKECLDTMKKSEILHMNYGISKQMEYFIFLRNAGIPIKYLPTEEPFDHLEFLKEKLPEHADFYDKLSEMLGDKKSNPHAYALLYGIPQLKEVLCAHRDSQVFANVFKHGKKQNILFIGNAHKLADFENKKHDLKTYRINFGYSNGDITLEGKIPERFEKIVHDCRILSAEKGFFLVDDIQYVK
jgi:hypothetical protein